MRKWKGEIPPTDNIPGGEMMWPLWNLTTNNKDGKYDKTLSPDFSWFSFLWWEAICRRLPVQEVWSVVFKSVKKNFSYRNIAAQLVPCQCIWFFTLFLANKCHIPSGQGRAIGKVLCVFYRRRQSRVKGSPLMELQNFLPHCRRRPSTPTAEMSAVFDDTKIKMSSYWKGFVRDGVEGWDWVNNVNKNSHRQRNHIVGGGRVDVMSCQKVCRLGVERLTGRRCLPGSSCLIPAFGMLYRQTWVFILVLGNEMQ